jgi:hypothetical protein
MPRDDHASTNRSIMKELTALKELAKSLVAKIDSKLGEVRERYRGDLDLMLSERVIAERYLHNADASLRLLVLEILADHWGPDEAYYTECERLAAADPALSVRAYALKRLGFHYKGTTNERLLTLAARTARENANEEWFAYLAFRIFCLVAGLESVGTNGLSGLRLFNIDWGVMEPFC